MKTLKFIILGLIFLTLINCENENFTTTDKIKISYQLLDNVSPLYVILEVDKEVHYISWTVNDSDEFIGNEKSMKILFDKPGINKIKLTVSGVDNKKYQKDTIINIPNVAKKLIIEGFYFENKDLLNLDRDSIVIQFYHYNKSENPIFKTTYRSSDFIKQDTVRFEKPLIFNVFQKNDYRNLINSDIFFYIESTPSMTIIHKQYFRTNFDVVSVYFERLSTYPYRIKLFDINSRNELYLLAHWED